MDEETWLTLSEAAAYLGVSVATITRFVKNGTLKAYPSQLDKRAQQVEQKSLDALKTPKR